MTSPARPPQYALLHRVGVHGLAIIAILLLLVIPVGSFAHGWRVHTLTTPSMGRTAPVGSVVLSEPVTAAQIRVGDVLAVHPPGRPDTTFVHRVSSITTGPTGLLFHTKGDINGSPDPWTVTTPNIIGRVILVLPDVGYLLHMLPLLLLAGFLTLLFSFGMTRGRRAPARILTGSLLVAAAIAYYQPLARIDLIAETTTTANTEAALVTTGILPLRVQAVGGTHADLTPGQVGTLHSTNHNTRGTYHIDAGIHLFGWWWLLTLTWTIPLLAAARSTRPTRAAPRYPPDHHRRQLANVMSRNYRADVAAKDEWAAASSVRAGPDMRAGRLLKPGSDQEATGV